MGAAKMAEAGECAAEESRPKDEKGNAELAAETKHGFPPSAVRFKPVNSALDGKPAEAEGAVRKALVPGAD